MTDTTTTEPTRQAGNLGRKSQLPEGERYAIKWAHEYFGAPPPVTYPLDVTGGVTEWGMLGNGPDPTLTVGPTPQRGYGDCVPAATFHDKMVGIALGHLGEAEPTSNAVATVYLEYDKGSDEGVVIGDWLLWAYQQKIIAGFAPVQLNAIDGTMAQFRRPVMIGVNLTDGNMTEFNNGVPLAAGPSEPPDPNLGHGVLKAYAENTGDGKIVTWAQLHPCTASWFSLTVEEAWIILTPEDQAALPADQWEAMVADLDALPQAQGPQPAPAPPPPPEPTPPAPAPPPPPSPSPTPPPTPPAPPSGHEAWWQEFLAWLEKVLGLNPGSFTAAASETEAADSAAAGGDEL